MEGGNRAIGSLIILQIRHVLYKMIHSEIVRFIKYLGHWLYTDLYNGRRDHWADEVD